MFASNFHGPIEDLAIANPSAEPKNFSKDNLILALAVCLAAIIVSLAGCSIVCLSWKRRKTSSRRRSSFEPQPQQPTTILLVPVDSRNESPLRNPVDIDVLPAPLRYGTFPRRGVLSPKLSREGERFTAMATALSPTESEYAWTAVDGGDLEADARWSAARQPRSTNGFLSPKLCRNVSVATSQRPPSFKTMPTRNRTAEQSIVGASFARTSAGGYRSGEHVDDVIDDID